jgi:hypothetical protein
MPVSICPIRSPANTPHKRHLPFKQVITRLPKVPPPPCPPISVSTSTTISNKNSNSKFTLFKKLPTEIRIRIWELAIKDSDTPKTLSYIPDPTFESFTSFTSLYEDPELDDRRFCYNFVHLFLVLKSKGKGKGEVEGHGGCEMPLWLRVSKEARGVAIRGFLMGEGKQREAGCRKCRRWGEDGWLSLPVGRESMGVEEGLEGRCLHVVREGGGGKGCACG